MNSNFLPRLTGIADEAGASLDEQIRAHQTLGWQQLELRKVDGENVALADEPTCVAIAERLQAEGLGVAALGSPIGSGAHPVSEPFERSVEMMQRALKNAVILKTSRIRVMSYPNDGLEEAEWHREALRRVRKLGKMAEDAGVTLMLENCAGWAASSPEQFAEFLEELDTPAVRAVFDTGNPASHHKGAPRVMEWFEAARPYLVHVHIKDHTGRAPGIEPRHVWPGEGACCIREILTKLDVLQYEGLLSIEPHLGIHPDHTTKTETYLDYGTRMKRLLQAG